MAQRLAGRFEAWPIAAVNITPLVPVLLVLLAVIAAGASTPQRAMKLDVPPEDPGPMAFSLPRIPMVSVGLDGGFQVEGRPVSAEQLGAEVKTLSQQRKLRVIMVRAEPDTSYGDYMRAVRIIHNVGLLVKPINEDLH